jgi:dTDP-4-amino-4,6-dideoxy-D-glucose acyltransferase
MSFYSVDELRKLGVSVDGNDVKVSRKASIYNAAGIHIGDHSRVDDFTVLSAGPGGIFIGRHVHISVFVSIIGKGRVSVADFAGLSGRVSVYSSTDDFSGNWMTGPTVSEEYLNVQMEDVYVGRHVVVGAGSVILPGAILHDGCAVGAMSLVKGVLDPFFLYAGIPARSIRPRERKFIEMEERLIQAESATLLP